MSVFDWSKIKVGDVLLDEDGDNNVVVGMFGEPKVSLIVTKHNNYFYAWYASGQSAEDLGVNLLPPQDPLEEFRNLPVDAPIWVRDKGGCWEPRHFCKVDRDGVWTWIDGGTSHTESNTIWWDEATTKNPNPEK